MLLDKIGNVLDFQCHIILRNHYQVLMLSEKIGFTCSASMFIRKDLVELRFYIASADENNREMRILLETSRARKVDGVWIIYTNSKHFPELESLKELIKLDSVVMDYFLLKDGLFHVNFRFHSSDLRKVSNLLLGFSNSLGAEFQIEYLGKNEGLMSIISKLNRVDPLSYLSFEGVIPENEKSPLNNPVGDQWIREIRYISDSEQISSIYSMEGKVKSPSSVKELGPHIYEATTKNQVINDISKKSIEKGVPTICRIQAIKGKTFTMEYVIPSYYQSHFMKIMSEIVETYPDWNFNILELGKFPSI
jgi:hypothetical protein